MTEFITKLIDLVDRDQPLKLTLAKPRDKNDELRNVFFRPISIKDEVQWQATFRFKTNDKTKNYSGSNMVSMVEEYVNNRFYNADLYTQTHKISLLQSKKGSQKVLIKKEVNNIKVEGHDAEKRRLIPENATFLKALGLSSQNGKVYAQSQNKYRQINKYLEIVDNLIDKSNRPRTIVDMGSGKGYLTFGLYQYFKTELKKKVEIIGVELKPDLIRQCNELAQELQFEDLKFQIGSIDSHLITEADMVIALHACDIATDMAIAKGLEADAKYIVMAPCCHKQIRKSMTPTDSSLSPLLDYGIFKERQAEMITDTIRALILESRGYDVKVFEFISLEHTGKNIIITAVKTNNKNTSALAKIAALKAEFGISEHYLETLLKEKNI